MDLKNIYSGKRVLITGATGLIGSNLVRRLLTFANLEVVACGRSREKLESVFHEEMASGLRILEHDIGKPLSDACGDFDYIFHAAAPISGAEIRSDPISSISANIHGAENCLEYLRRQRTRQGRSGVFVVFSSATVYGSAKETDRVCKENETSVCEDLSSPTAAYSESKRMVEVLAKAYCRQCGIGVRIVRFGYVYGKCVVPPKTAFYEFVRQAVHGEDMVFNGSGFGRRDNIYVDDAVEGLLTVCERGEDAVPYNISSNGELGNLAAIDEIALSIGRAAAAVGITSKVWLAGDTPRAPGLRLDNSKLKALGWSLRTSLDDGVREIFSFMRKKHVS